MRFGVYSWLFVPAAWCAPAAMLLPAGNALRIAAVIVDLLVFPGLPLVLRLSPERYALEGFSLRTVQRVAVLTGAVSLSSAILVTLALMLAGALTAERALVILALVATVATLVPAGRGTGRTGPEAR